MGKQTKKEKQIQNTKTIYRYLLPAKSGTVSRGQGFKSRWSPVLFFVFFFQGFLRKCINCVHNCEDHSSFDFISAVLI